VTPDPGQIVWPLRCCGRPAIGLVCLVSRLRTALRRPFMSFSDNPSVPEYESEHESMKQTSLGGSR
jgi:hypothetical protein